MGQVGIDGGREPGTEAPACVVPDPATQVRGLGTFGGVRPAPNRTKWIMTGY